MNHNRMTIRAFGDKFQVYKLKPQSSGYATDMAGRKVVFSVSRVATPRFTGSYGDCMTFIGSQGAEFMSEHGIPV